MKWNSGWKFEMKFNWIKSTHRWVAAWRKGVGIRRNSISIGRGSRRRWNTRRQMRRAGIGQGLGFYSDICPSLSARLLYDK